ncbi:MAG: hypothetical protein M3Q29_06840 [Chloroflexota bacterium]|nr:hypothetical protein [Chloroflexota bacterium]
MSGELLPLAVEILFGLLVAAAICWSIAHPANRHDLRPHQAHSEWLAAKARAEQLLAEMLTEEEYQQLSRRGYIEVKSPSVRDRVYRIPKYRGRIHVYEREKPVMSLCVQPVQLVPDADVVLIHKLMIEGNEQEYLRLANRFEVTPFRQYL